jgi:hypothetical protein
MQPTDFDLPPARPAASLEASLEAVEAHLAALGLALRDRDAAAVERHATHLHRALAAAMHRFVQASRQPSGVPQPLRQRLALAGGQVAAQRESLARATASLDRAIDVLLPPSPAAVYGHPGLAERPLSSGLQA